MGSIVLTNNALLFALPNRFYEENGLFWEGFAKMHGDVVLPSCVCS